VHLEDILFLSRSSDVTSSEIKKDVEGDDAVGVKALCQPSPLEERWIGEEPLRSAREGPGPTGPFCPKECNGSPFPWIQDTSCRTRSTRVFTVP